MAKAKKIRMMTPVVPLNFINVINPDDKFDKDNPKYQVSWKLPPVEGKAFIKEVEEKVPHLKGKVPHKRDDEDNYIFKAVQKKVIQWKVGTEMKRSEFTPTVLHADNTPYEGREPWGGSQGEVAFILRETNGQRGQGLTLALQGVRFHEVVVGSEEGGDNLFSNNTKEVAPQEFEETDGDEDDDAPFN